MAKKAQKKKNIREEAVKAAMKLAAAQGWAQLGLQDIAAEAGLSLTEMHEYFDSRDDILAALGRMIDRRVLEQAGQGASDLSPRDRLFDILMERFEIMNEYRDGLKAVLSDMRFDPKQAVIAMPHLCRSMSWMLEAAGLDTDGMKGAVKVAGLSGIYLNVLRVWLEDDSADLSKTMAALDKNLARAEQAAGYFGF